jgi:DNA-binding transcriptional MocR family regulator
VTGQPLTAESRQAQGAGGGLATRGQVNVVEQIPPEVLGDALADWTMRTGHTYLRLADAIAAAIAQGHLGLGSRLPSERSLAGHLHLARGTVVAAYDVLRAREIVQTRRGSGTVIQIRAVLARSHRAPLLSRLVDGHEAPIDLALAAPMLSHAELANITVSVGSAARLLPAHGYAPLGLAPLRAAVAERFARRGIPTSPDQILITNGGQGALSLIANGLLSANDRVLTETPTYPAAIEAFVRAGSRVEGIERDHAGPILSRLEQAQACGSARLMYLIPTCHNPTGAIMSHTRRLAVLSALSASRALVVEDTVTEDLTYGHSPPPSLAALAPDRVITVGSLSKTVWSGLRVGWIRASTETTLRLGRIRAGLELGSPVLDQAAALEIFDRYDELIAERRALMRARAVVLCEEIRERLPEWSFSEPQGGLSIWAALPCGSADDLAQLALRRGVAIAPGRTAAPDEEFLAHVRVSAGPSPELIREGIKRLAAAWSELQSSALCYEQQVLV